MQSDIWSYIDMGNTNSPKSRNETPYFSPNKNNCKICDTSLLYKIYLGFNIISLILPYTVNLSYCTVKSNVQVNSYMSSTNLRMPQELNNSFFTNKPSKVLMAKGRTLSLFHHNMLQCSYFKV